MSNTRMARQPRSSQEEERILDSVRRFHRPKQGIPEEQLSTTTHRPHRRGNGMKLVTHLYGRLPRIQPNTDPSGGPGENLIHHREKNLLLQSYAIRTQECQSNLSVAGERDVLGPIRKHDRGVS